MNSQETIENKISSVRKYLTILENYKKYTRSQIEESLDLRGAVERYLYLAIQSTIDLAGAYISYRNYRKPTTMSDSFVILKERKVVPDEIIKKMILMTGLRNVITHDYDELDYGIVVDVLNNGTKDIESFLESLSKFESEESDFLAVLPGKDKNKDK